MENITDTGDSQELTLEEIAEGFEFEPAPKRSNVVSLRPEGGGSREKEVRAHVHMLHDLAAGLDGHLCAGFIKRDPKTFEKRGTDNLFFRAGAETNKMANFIIARSENRNTNLYHSLCVFKFEEYEEKRRTKANAIAALGIVADMDNDRGKGGDLPFDPSYMLETSPGNFQAVFLFDQPFMLDTQEARARFDNIARRMRQACACDAGNTDPAHLWRIPGTFNAPNKEKIQETQRPSKAALVVYSRKPTRERFDLAKLDKQLPALAAGSTETDPAKPGQADTDWDAPKRKNGLLKQFLEKPYLELMKEGGGAAIYQSGKWPSKSEAVAGLIMHMFNQGLSPAEARQLLEKYSDGIISRTAHDGKGISIKAEVVSAWRKYNRGPKFHDFVYESSSNKYIYKPLGYSVTPWTSQTINQRLTKRVETDWGGQPVRNGKGDLCYISPSLALAREVAVEQVTSIIGREQIIKSAHFIDGELVGYPGARVFNLYRPANLAPGDASKAKPYVDHVRKLYPNDADHILDFFAFTIQHPGQKINHALLLGGKPGIGKDTILLPLRMCVGPWNYRSVSPAQIMGRFNAHLEAHVVHISEVRDLGSTTDRYNFYEHLKDILAAPPETHTIDRKNIQTYEVPNVNSTVITTNHATGGIYLPEEDRRHYVAFSNARVGENGLTDDYFWMMYSWFAQEGYGHVLAYLLERDLEEHGFDPKAKPKKTAAFMEIVHSEQPAEVSALRDLFEEWGNPDAIRWRWVKLAGEKFTPDMQPADNDLNKWLNSTHIRRTAPMRMAEAGYVKVAPTENKNAGRWTFPDGRDYTYVREDTPPQQRVAVAEQLQLAEKAKAKAEAKADKVAT